MKFNSLADFNAIGLQNDAQKVIYAAWLLFAAANGDTSKVKIQTTETATVVNIVLPYNPQALGQGIPLPTSAIGSVTPGAAALSALPWLGDKASNVPTTNTVLPTSVEQYLYMAALSLSPLIMRSVSTDARRLPTLDITVSLPHLSNRGVFSSMVAEVVVSN